MSKKKVLVIVVTTAIYLLALLWFYGKTNSDPIQLVFSVGMGMGLFRFAYNLVRPGKSTKTKTIRPNVPHVPDHTGQDAQDIPHHQAHQA
jgi:hypothetical protein